MLESRALEPKTKKLAGIIRRCLGQRYILRTRSPELFQSLLIHSEDLRSFFATASLELRMNEPLGIAYLSVIDAQEEEMEYRWGRTKILGSLETLVLIFLRQKRMEYFTGNAISEIALIRNSEIREYLRGFSEEKEDKKFQRKFDEVLGNLIENQILLNTPLSHEGDSSYEITPVCDILLPADRIWELKSQAQTYFGGDQS